jgi:hypothetical protein
MCIGAAIAAASSGGSAQATLAIRKAPTHNVSCSAGICTATADYATMNVGELTSMLASSNVTLVSGKAKDIKVETAFSWASAHRLTLDSRRSIRVNQTVTVAGSGALTITTNDHGTGGTFFVMAPAHIDFWDLSDNLVINGENYTLESDIAFLTNDIEHNPSGHYALASDVGAAGTPIPTHFTGTLDGLGHFLGYGVFDGSKNAELGFFSWIDVGGVVENVRLSAGVTGDSLQVISGLAAMNYGLIANTSGTGTVRGLGKHDIVGGLVAENYGSVVSSSFSGTVWARYGSRIGGLIGVQGESSGHLGSTINSPSTATLTCPVDCYAGGLIGVASGSITGSWASGSVTIGGENAITPTASAGGLVGYFLADPSTPGTISNSYATGAITGGQNANSGQNVNVGGLIGVTSVAGGSGSVVDSYSTGALTGGAGSFVGGLIGYDAQQANTDDYWDIDTSGVSDPSQGAGNIANDPGITGLTTAQLQSGLPAGFDPSIWAESPSINGGLPYLIANPPP